MEVLAESYEAYDDIAIKRLPISAQKAD